MLDRERSVSAGIRKVDGGATRIKVHELHQRGTIPNLDRILAGFWTHLQP